MRRLLLLIILGVTLVLLSCQTKEPIVVNKTSEGSRASSTSEDSLIQALNDSIIFLRIDLSALEEKVRGLESNYATVHTNEDTYGVATTRFGRFVIVTRGVSPYLDGYKVKLAIGNITTATFRGAKIRVIWQLPFPEKWTTEKSREWRESLKSKEFDVTNAFLPGKYTSVDLALVPAKPAELRDLQVGLEFNMISISD